MLSKFQKLKWPGKDNTDANKNNKTEVSSNTRAESNTPRANSDAPSAADINERLSSPKEKIRAAACLDLKDSGRLLDIAKNDSSADIRQLAARQFARLTAPDETTKSLIQDYAAAEDTRYLARLITALNGNAKIREYGITLFSTDEDYLKITVETRFHDTRQSVSEKIQSLEIVDQCFRQIKAKDKVVARTLKQKLTEQSEARAKNKSNQEEIEKITDEMQKLAHGAWSPTFTHRYELFAQKWKNLEFEITPSQQQLYETARTVAAKKAQDNLEAQKLFTDCESLIATLENASSGIATATIETLPECVAATQKETDVLFEQWQKLCSSNSAQLIDKSHQQRFNKARTTATSDLTDAKAILKACEHLQQQKDGATNQLKKQLKALQQLHSELTGKSNQPAYVAELPDLINTLKIRINNQESAAQELKLSIKKQLGSLKSAISANRWGPAKSIHERLARKIERLDGNDRKFYSEQLQRHEKKLKDLGDWKQFATEPKLEALCESMEKLPDVGLSPKDQADRIKELQNQWKSMGASPAQEKHWERFKTAADIAYAPCAEYFTKKRAEKKDKLSKRGEIIDMLQKYIDQSDWENPDAKLVEKTIRAAKTEWRNTRVFDRKAGAKLEERFTEVLAQLNEKLAPAYEAGVAEKTDLIAKVKTLAEGEVNQHSINQVKRLQAMWRVTSATRRNDDQKLWTEFNNACSEIYNAHRSIQQEQYAASVEHVTRGKQIIAELKSVRNTSVALDEKAVQQLQDEFNGLPEFPERDQKYFVQRFQSRGRRPGKTSAERNRISPGRRDTTPASQRCTV